MTGLGDLFDEAEGRAARDAAGARLEGEELGSVHSRVRRAHARRSAFQASLVAVAVVVVGIGVAYGAMRGGTQAADLPGPSASTTPSPSVSPSPSITGVAWPGFSGNVTVDPHLPSAAAVTEAVWDGVLPGWALISYREAWVDSGGADVRGPQVVYLVSPQGDRYELTTVDGDTVSVLAWEVGATTAAVSVQPEGDPPFAGMLNLVTGEVTSIEGYAPYVWSVAFLDSDGVPVWRGNDATSAYMRIAPDGIQKDYKIPAEDGAAELAKATIGATGCGVSAPFSEREVLVTCSFSATAPTQAVARVSAQDGTVVELFVAPEGEVVGAVSRAGDVAVAPTGDWDEFTCPNVYALLQGGDAVSVPGADANLHPDPTVFTPFGTHLNRLTWGMTSACERDPKPMVVVTSDLGSDAYAVLVPYPEGRPPGEEPHESVTGVAVAR